MGQMLVIRQNPSQMKSHNGERTVKNCKDNCKILQKKNCKKNL